MPIGSPGSLVKLRNHVTGTRLSEGPGVTGPVPGGRLATGGAVGPGVVLPGVVLTGAAPGARALAAAVAGSAVHVRGRLSQRVQSRRPRRSKTFARSRSVPRAPSAVNCAVNCAW